MSEAGPRPNTAEPSAVLAIEVVRHGGAWDDSKIDDALVWRAAQAAFAIAAPKDQAAQGPATYDATIVLTDDTEMTELNRDWRGKDAPTNVLSFPAGDVPGEPGPLGDVVIAFETTEREAGEDRM